MSGAAGAWWPWARGGDYRQTFSPLLAATVLDVPLGLGYGGFWGLHIPPEAEEAALLWVKEEGGLWISGFRCEPLAGDPAEETTAGSHRWLPGTCCA